MLIKLNKKYQPFIILLIIQIFAVIMAGIISKDKNYAIIISLIGLIFNMLVSLNICYGFIFGFIYAILNGILAYKTNIYATALFMLFLQAPMAIYSFIVWKKNTTKVETPLKIMSFKKIIHLLLFMLIIGIGGYCLLKIFKSSNVFFDTIFFVFSVSACLLLAFRYKIAYIVTLASGLCGSILWISQMINFKSGLSIAVFYLIVTINSIIAIKKNYKRKKRL